MLIVLFSLTNFVMHKYKKTARLPRARSWGDPRSPYYRAFQCRILEVACIQKGLWSRYQRLRHRSRCSWWGGERDCWGRQCFCCKPTESFSGAESSIVTSQTFFRAGVSRHQLYTRRGSSVPSNPLEAMYLLSFMINIDTLLFSNRKRLKIEIKLW